MFAYEGAPGFRFYSGGPGAGAIRFDDTGVTVIPSLELSFRSITSGNWRRGERPVFGKPGTDSFGASPNFVLIRAYLLSARALRLRVEMFQASTDANAAAREIHLGTLFSQWAQQARLAALTQCGKLTSEWETRLVSDPGGFVEKCQEAISATDPEDNSSLAHAMRLYGPRVELLMTAVEEAESRLAGEGFLSIHPTPFPGVRDEVLELCKLISRAASRADGLPTKAAVRHLLSGHPLPQLADIAAATNSFGEFLKIAGFHWLPTSKAGRTRKNPKNDRH